MLKKDKPKEVEELVSLMNKYNVIGIINLHGLPTRQLQQIKNSLNDIAITRVSKKTLIKRAIEKVDKKGIEKLEEKIEGPCGLLLTNQNPFKLYKYIKQNKSFAAAKKGDLVNKDIVIKKGPLSLPPGPAITALQKLGLKTKVQDGKIHILSERVVLKKGEAVTEDHVNVFNMLKMEPMEIMLNLTCALEDGMLYEKDVLDIDETEYLNNIRDCVQKAINLSLNTGYLTKLTSPLAIQKAFNESKRLCLEANILEGDFIDELLLKAVREAKSLESKIPQMTEEVKTEETKNSETQESNVNE
jgi:large subunit ribosomal protein L10